MEYHKFINEYLNLGHMRKVDERRININGRFYLPHHGVIKENSSTTKLRVVFDGSCKSSTGVSINDILEVGPVLQNNLIDVLTRFRQHKVAFVGDIEKMYRQVLVDEKDRHMQRILFRINPHEVPTHYELCTVTYGMAPAAFLAVKTLLKLADDYQDEYPLACQAIRDSFYVDDFLGGAETTHDAKHLMDDVLKVLKAGGFHLRKLKSNCSEILSHLPLDDLDPLPVTNGENIGIPTLGLQWFPNADEFGYKIQMPHINSLTKRKLLSYVATIFDPLGWISPIVVRFKMLLQKMWLKSVEIHGFCDASEKAYGAVVYLRVIDEFDNVHINIIISKSKIAPIKQISLPKLELCGALLLSRLVKYVNQIINIDINHINAWCDSKIVLAWIQGNPREWKCFVGNRISEISDQLPYRRWNYVKSEDNPADFISRGSSAIDLVNNLLWWKGPSWLMQHINNRHDMNEFFHTSEESRSQPQYLSFNLAIAKNNDTLEFIFKYFSSFQRTKRVIARCLSWKRRKSSGHLYDLYMKAENMILQYVQSISFCSELRSLHSKKSIDTNSKLQMLPPFLDNDGPLRVGGRLVNANIAEGTKHPVIIPDHHPLGYLIARDLHEQNLHAGPTLLTNLIRQQFWILRVRNIVRKVYHSCMVCAKHRATPKHQPMGNIPAARVTPSRPFLHTSVDYAGPIQLKLRNGRGRQQLTKGYIALFICFATKAIHIEMVSDLSTNAFIQALKRFSSRRGLPAEIHSDNGTNFIGAKNSLHEMFSFLEANHDRIANADFLLQHRIKFKFIPPRAPNFGGLWEANIKAVKFHLKRVVNAPFTYEDMSTMLTQIEALLNSRPLCPLHEDPTSLDVLTPGHFLIGQSLLQLPQPDVSNLNESRLTRWQNLQLRVQVFWQRWSCDYLNHLIQTCKWKGKETSLKINELVLVKDENLPPSMWLLGRIDQVYFGDDGLIRVVNVKTRKGMLKRAINKICKLPQHDIENEKQP